MVFGLFGNKDEPSDEEEVDVEPVSFLGPISGQELNLRAHPKLVEAGLLPAKELVTEALSRRADALRIDPQQGKAGVTWSIDGVPHSGGALEKTEALAITQMLKLLSGLDIKLRTAPQAGALKAEFQSQPWRLDVRSVPTPRGERLIVRAANLKHKLDTPSDLGMGESLRLRLRELCGAPGLILVAGPPGSGVTTTLFSLVRNIDSYIYTIFTLADLDGRALDLVSPQTREGDDLGAMIGRAIRMEANVILCNPLRDAPTARTLLARADQIMLLAEMPARDSVTALRQLVEWAGDREPVAAGLKGILTQKLIRRLCSDCKQAYKPRPDMLKKLGLPADLAALYRPPAAPEGQSGACPRCDGSGYFGRTGLFEFLEVTEGIKALVSEDADAAAVRARMKEDGQTTLRVDGLRLVAEGVTSLEELQRIFKPAAEK